MNKLYRWLKGWYVTLQIYRNKELMESIRRAQIEVEEGKFYTREDIFGSVPDKNHEK